MSMPRSIRSRASVPSRTSLAAMIVSLSTLGASGSAAVDDPHDVGFLHDHHFLAVDLDFGPRELAEEDTIAGLDIKRMNLAVFAADARSDRDDIAFHGFFLGGVGDEDPSCSLRLLLDAPHQHAIVQWSEFHQKLRKLKIQCAPALKESSSGTSLNAKISMIRRRMRSALRSNPSRLMTDEQSPSGQAAQPCRSRLRSDHVT